MLSFSCSLREIASAVDSDKVLHALASQRRLVGQHGSAIAELHGTVAQMAQQFWAFGSCYHTSQPCSILPVVPIREMNLPHPPSYSGLIFDQQPVDWPSEFVGFDSDEHTTQTSILLPRFHDRIPSSAPSSSPQDGAPPRPAVRCTDRGTDGTGRRTSGLFHRPHASSQVRLSGRESK